MICNEKVFWYYLHTKLYRPLCIDLNFWCQYTVQLNLIKILQSVSISKYISENKN